MTEPKFCLFHQKTDCACISPVLTQKALKARLEHAIRNHELNNKFCQDEDLVKSRLAEIEVWRERLALIQS